MKTALLVGFLSSVCAQEHFPANSKYGQRLLSAATVVQEPERRATDEGWDLGSMYIQYEGCSSYQDYGDRSRYNSYYGFASSGSDLNTVNLVRFTLCKDSSCGQCSGQYAVDMVTFLMTFDEHKKALDELDCLQIQSKCTCSNNDDLQSCYNSCYKQAGKKSCIVTYDQNGNEKKSFDLQEYIQCKEMEPYHAYSSKAGYYQDAGSSQGTIYYVGPYCKNAKDIYLGSFFDNECTLVAEHATFTSDYQAQSGESFPYFQSPIIQQGVCMWCEDEEERYDLEDATLQAYENYKKQQAQTYGRNYYYGSYKYNSYQKGTQKKVNDLCAFAAQGSDDNVLRCDDYEKDGCLLLELLPDLDGRSAGRYGATNIKLELDKNNTVVLAVLAAVLGMVVVSLLFCDPTKIVYRNVDLAQDGDSIMKTDGLESYTNESTTNYEISPMGLDSNVLTTSKVNTAEKSINDETA